MSDEWPSLKRRTIPKGKEPDEITRHIACHLGQPLDQAIHEAIGLLRIQVVPASADRPFQTLVTTGMSEYSMTAPEGHEDYRHIELYMHLPGDWPLTKEAWKDQDHYWPIRWMRLIAHYPESSPVFLASEHTIGDSPVEPFAPGTGLSCMMLLERPDELGPLRLADGRTVRFYQLVPLYEEERVLKERKGTGALFGLFDQHSIGFVVDPHRPNVAKLAKP
jgi:hypothetical protein